MIFLVFLSRVIFFHHVLWGNGRWSCVDTVSMLFVHGRAMLVMEEKSTLPMHIAILCEKEEVKIHHNRII
jgi:hypothetical protein